MHRHVHLVADTMQLCSLCQTRVSERWITMQRISDITQTGSRAREKEDHLSSTVFQPQDETSVSGVRRKNPFSLNCLVNPEVVRAGAELCKRRRDEANSTTSLWWGQSGFTDVSERSGYPGGMEWRGGGGPGRRGWTGDDQEHLGVKTIWDVEMLLRWSGLRFG